MPEPALWAVYFQMTLTSKTNPAESERMQWIFLPPFTGSIVPAGAKESPQPSYFFRKQEKLGQRTVWNHYKEGLAQMVSGIPALEAAGWVAQPLITIEVAPWEMAEITKAWKFPYRLESRFKRVSNVTHQYTI